MNKELWLEFGFLQQNNSYEDMCWYNEGRARELPYFIKYFIKHLFSGDLFKLNMYYKMGLGKITIYLKK